jgi:hypothetical protein
MATRAELNKQLFPRLEETMTNWQAIAARVSDLFKPESDTSVFHYDREVGAILVSYVESVTQEELADYSLLPIDWRLVSFGGLIHLCHAFPGRSWNETPISFFADEAGLQELLDSELAELSITYLLLDAGDGHSLLRRDCILGTEVTSQLQVGLRLQKELGLDSLLETEKLREPTEALQELVVPGAPEVVRVSVDENKRTTLLQVKSPVRQERNEPRPRWLLRSITANPNLDFKAYEVRVARYASRGERPPWRYCFFPVNEIRQTEQEKQRFALTDQLATMGIRGEDAETYLASALAPMISSQFPYAYLAMMLSWRQGQGVYRYDPELLRTLFLTTLPIHLNPEIFTRLPEFCAYVETPMVRTTEGYPMHGFFAMAEGTLNLDENTLEVREERRMWILLDIADSPGGLSQQRIIVFSLDSGSVGDCLQTLEELTNDGRAPRQDLIHWLSPLLSQLLYLCSEEPEILSHSGPRHEIEQPAPIKTRKGYKFFVPSAATIWACGWRLGALIRKAKTQAAEQKGSVSTDEPRTPPRGHTRRAHWHLFWAGKRTAAVREPRVKYLPMLRVNLKEDDGPPPTVIRGVTAN